jgi:UDP-glucuronate 4-epimerase
LLKRGDEVVGFDVVNDYYDPRAKEARLLELHKLVAETGSRFSLVRADLADQTAVDTCFAQHDFDRVIHLAAQAGVCYSLVNPRAYVRGRPAAALLDRLRF